MRAILPALAMMSIMGFVAHAGDPVPVTPAFNPRYVEWLEREQMRQRQKPKTLANVVRPAGGYAVMEEVPPDPVDYSYLTNLPQRVQRRISAARAACPASYDSRSYGYITSVKNQNPYGTCWAHAVMGAVEASLKKKEGVAYDLSENNLVTRHLFNYKEDKGRFDNGGHTYWAEAYFLSWNGPALEEQDRYPTLTSNKALAPFRHVQESRLIPPRTSSSDNDMIKHAVMTYGSVPCYFFWDSRYYNTATAAFYCDEGLSCNHAVLLVGWDDNYSKSNFRTAPPGNGAFLLKNSWDATWGKDGYFWLSYYDRTLDDGGTSAMRAFSGIEDASNYDQIYQYDPLGKCNAFGWTNTDEGWGANIFTCEADATVMAVGYYANVPSTEYEIRVYRDCVAGEPRSGTLACSQSGVSDGTHAGYYTVSLDAPVPVRRGSRFSVVFKLKTPGYDYPLSFEYAIAGRTDWNASAKAGESYYSYSGDAWTDLTTWVPSANFCFKAYAKSGMVADSGPANDRFANAAAIGNSSGSVTVSSQGATAESGEPSHGNSSATSSVWWRWTAPTSGTVTFSTEGSDFDTGLAVYTGSSVSALTKVAENDDVTGQRWSRLSFAAVAGQTYRIAVAGYRGATGTVCLSWSMAAATVSSVSISGPDSVDAGGRATYTCTAVMSDGSSSTVRPTWSVSGADGCASIGSDGVLVSGTVTEETSVSVMAEYATGGISRSATKSVRILPNVSRPGNDDFAAAKVLSGASGEVSASNVGATAESGEPAHGNAMAVNSVWWRWTASASGTVTFSTEGSDFDTGLAVYTGSAVSALTKVVANDDANTGEWVTWSLVTFDAVAGTTYRIAVAGYRGQTGSIHLKWEAETVSLMSIAISGGTSVRSGDTLKCLCTANMSDGTSKTVSPRWSITGGAAYAEIDADTGVLTAKTVFAAQNVTVSAVYTEGGVTHTATRTITVNPPVSGPANDAFAKATPISGSTGTVKGSNVNATQEGGESQHGESGAVNSVWWKWVAPASGSVEFSTQGSDFDTGLAIYTGTTVGSLELVASNGDDPAGGRTSRVGFRVVAGRTYMIAVAGYRGASGGIVLTWKMGTGQEFVIEGGVLVAWNGTGGTDIVIPEGVTEVAEKAFYLSDITSVKFPSSMRTVGASAFAICNNLTNVTFNSGLREIRGQAFGYNAKLSGLLVLPDSVQEIEYCAFSNTGYEWAVLPTSVRDISWGMFHDCASLSRVYFRGNAPEVWHIFPSSDTYAGTPESLVSYVPLGSTGWTASGGSALPARWPDGDGVNARPIKNYSTSASPLELATATGMFSSVAQQRRFSVRAISSWSASTAASWVSLSQSTGTGFGSVVFSLQANTAAASRTAQIRVTSGSTTVAYSVTQQGVGDERLNHFTIEDGILTAWDGEGPGDVVIPDGAGIREIGEKAFYVKSKLTSVTLPSGLKKIGDHAFGICSHLTNVVFNSELEEICDWAFCLDDALAGRLYIPDAVRIIGSHAFWGTGYSSAVLPGGMSCLGYAAFCECESLTSVYFNGNAPAEIGASWSARSGIYEDTPLTLTTYVPTGSTGWNGSGTSLPSFWPADDGEDARAIRNYSPSFKICFIRNDGSGTMEDQVCARGKVYNLRKCSFTKPGKVFAGWAGSNGRRYEDGMLVFDLAKPGETVTMTAIWE